MYGEMTTRERLIATIRLEEADRVPVTLYEINPYVGDDWRVKDLSYSRLLRLAKELQDTFASTPIGDPNFSRILEAAGEDQVQRRISDVGVFYSSADTIEAYVKKRRVGNSLFYENTVETPKGPLHSVERVDDNVATTWQVEPFIKEEKDVERILSLPYKPIKPSLNHFFEAQKKLGDRGLMLLSLGDPLGVTVPLFRYEGFLNYAHRRKNEVLELLNTMHERFIDLYRYLTSMVHGTVFRIWGPEYVTPPTMAPSYFDEFVAQYDSELIRIVQESGNYSCIHCHGKLDAVLERIVEMKPDMLEPIEPPPRGDVTLPELKRRAGDHMCLMGYIEAWDLELGSREVVDSKVEEAVSEGAPGGGYIMLPSATPIVSPLPRNIEENLIQYLQSGRKYGQYLRRTSTPLG